MEVFLCMPNNPIFTFHPCKCCLHASSTGHGSTLSRTAAQLCQEKQFWNIHLGHQAICCLPTKFAHQWEPSKAFTLLRSRNCCRNRAQALLYLQIKGKTCRYSCIRLRTPPRFGTLIRVRTSPKPQNAKTSQKAWKLLEYWRHSTKILSSFIISLKKIVGFLWEHFELRRRSNE